MDFPLPDPEDDALLETDADAADAAIAENDGAHPAATDAAGAPSAARLARLARKAQAARVARLRHKQFVSDRQNEVAALEKEEQELLKAEEQLSPSLLRNLKDELRKTLKPEEVQQLSGWLRETSDGAPYADTYFNGDGAGEGGASAATAPSTAPTPPLFAQLPTLPPAENAPASSPQQAAPPPRSSPSAVGAAASRPLVGVVSSRPASGLNLFVTSTPFVGQAAGAHPVGGTTLATPAPQRPAVKPESAASSPAAASAAAPSRPPHPGGIDARAAPLASLAGAASGSLPEFVSTEKVRQALPGADFATAAATAAAAAAAAATAAANAADESGASVVGDAANDGELELDDTEESDGGFVDAAISFQNKSDDEASAAESHEANDAPPGEEPTAQAVSPTRSVGAKSERDDDGTLSSRVSRKKPAKS